MDHLTVFNMQRINRTSLKDITTASPKLACGSAAKLPERIVQFGEGNFLRAFADWMVCELNAKELFNGSILAVQPIRHGMAPEIEAQEGLYTLLLRGVEKGKVIDSRRIITSINRAINPYDQWEILRTSFRSEELRFSLSNTTEAGITYVEEAFDPARCPESFPAKVATLLYDRYQHFKGDFNKGLVFLPCELIEKNGDKLRQTVLKQIEAWKLPVEFSAWVANANFFCNTLVDRIVPGYPREEASSLCAELGYEDKLLVAGEFFHLWVIEGPARLSDEIPFHKIGLNVIWTDDMTPYRTRKVRVLNGAHTASVLAAYTSGIDTVREMVENPVCGPFLRKAIFEEILPQVQLPDDEKKAYADSVVERFCNPFVRHELLSISLNSVSKWKVRVLPSLLDYQRRNGKTPLALSFSLAALIWFYRGERVSTNEMKGFRNGKAYPIKDDAHVLDFFSTAWNQARSMSSVDLEKLATATLARVDFWEMDLNSLPGMTKAVATGLHSAAVNGMRFTIENLLLD